MIYKVYFQLYGKKFKAAIQANSPAEAREIVKNNIQFDKVVKMQDYVNENDPTVQHLKNIFGIKD